jgi:hypothetical protein
MEASSADPQPPAPASPPVGVYPVRFDVTRQEHYSRGLIFVKWLLALPHFFVLIILGIGALFAGLIAFFAVLITGKYPRGIHDYIVGVSRWACRVVSYVYLLTDKYPPFSLDPDPDNPVTLEIDYPETMDRWRPLVQWILIIPYLIVAQILIYISFVVVFFAWFVILFTAKFPEGMFNLVVIPLRWSTRANAYEYFLVKQYPPFEWDS